MTTMAPSFVAPPAVAAPAYAAPAMASYAAPAMAPYAAPATTSYAAPAYAAPTMATVAAPAMTTMAPSFVAPPAVAPVPMVPQATLAPPVSLTANLPTPEQIAKQKAGYMAALDKQLKEASETVAQENAIEKQMVEFTTKKNIALMEMQVQEQLTEQLAASDEQNTVLQCELKKALVERNLQLKAQADNLIMDYNMKALISDCEMKKYAFAQQYLKEENKLAGQYMQQEIKAHTGTAYGAPAPAVPVK
jgi:hypothetical protein